MDDWKLKARTVVKVEKEHSNVYVFWHTWKRRSQIKNLNLIGAIRCCHVMYKLLYPSIRVRTAPPMALGSGLVLVLVSV